MDVLVVGSDRPSWQHLGALLAKLGLSLQLATSDTELLALGDGKTPPVVLVTQSSWVWAQPLVLLQWPASPIVFLKEEADCFVPPFAHIVLPAHVAPEAIAIDLLALALNASGTDEQGDAFSSWSSTLMDRLDALLAREFQAMLGVELQAVRAPDAPDVAVCAEIHVSVPEHDSEIVLGVGFDEPSAGVLSELLFGEDLGLAMMRDAVQEFANTAGGALKRAASRDGVELTLGIPEQVAPNLGGAAYARNLESETFHMRVWAHTERLDNGLATVTELHEGMVLRDDVRDDDGTLVAPGGVAITQETVRRITAALGPEGRVAVLRAA